MLQQALPRCLLLIETSLYGCLNRVYLVLEGFELRFQIYGLTSNEELFCGPLMMQVLLCAEHLLDADTSIDIG